MDHQSQCQNQKNIIDPEKIIDMYGADSARLFILSDSPPEKDVQWSDEEFLHHINLFKIMGIKPKILEEIEKDHPG